MFVSVHSGFINSNLIPKALLFTASSPSLISQHSGKRKCEETLEDLLNRTVKGRYILGYYGSHTKLDNDCRNKLVEIIIENELDVDHDNRIPRTKFTELSQRITDLFPTEQKVAIKFVLFLKLLMYNKFQEIYFCTIVKTRDGNRVVSGHGKLFSKYFNYRRKLKKVGLLALDNSTIHESELEHCCK